MGTTQTEDLGSAGNPDSAPDFLRGGGELGALMRANDWHSSPVGPPHTWPESLRLSIALLLNSRQPMYVWWGPELLCFYNDAYRRSIGSERHPASLGQPARSVWAEIWHIIGPQIEQVMSGAGGVSFENAVVPITRDGRLERVYWTYTYSPILASSADPAVGGVLVICTETTQAVLSAERTASELRQLAALFEQAPIFMAILRGPEHRFELVNPSYSRLVGHRPVIGKTVADAFPEVEEQGFLDLLDRVYRTGEPYQATASRIAMQSPATGVPEDRYLDFVYQPIRDETRTVTGIFVVGVDATDRSLAEAALRESEARFRDMADAAPVLSWISDAGKNCIWFNNRWLAFTGRSMEQESGDGWVEGIHPGDIDRCVAVYATAFDRRDPYRLEYRRRRADGEWRLLDASGVPRYVDGQFVGYIGSCIDITDQSAAARALSESEEQLRLATEAAEVGLWDLDLTTDTLFWPPRVKAMFGIPAEVPVSMVDFYGGLHPEDRARTTGAFEAAIDPLRRALYDVEYRTIGQADGRIRWVAAKGRGVFRGSRCVRVLGTAIDITTRKAAEAQLRELNERLEHRVDQALAERKVFVDIIESTDARVLVLDLNFRIMAINRVCAQDLERLYGVRARVGDDLLAILDNHPDERARVLSFWGRALTGEEFTASDEFDAPELDRRYYEMKFNALRDRHGKLLGAFQFVYDITERLRAQERLAEAERNLRQAQKIDAIGQLTGGVAHDFNNLLMVISGGLSLLQRHQDEERRQRIVEQMRQAADRGASLVRQLLTFARTQPVHATPVDLRRQIDGMREMLNRTLSGDVQVKTELAADLWPIKVDVAELELVILNLCVNARDAMPRGGMITIGARNVPQLGGDGNPDDRVVLTVADTGTGMASDVLARIFEPFFTTKEIGKGSGLGLPQVYGFAQRSGGGVQVDSAVGRGTTVALSIPRSQESPAQPSARPPDAAPSRQPELRGSILLVEDDDEVAALVGEMVRGLGYRTTRVSTAQAALGALADDREIDLVFSDVMMPGTMSGVDLAREVRRRRPGLPVLLTSGFPGKAMHGAAGENFQVLPKPYEMPELDRALREALGRPAPVPDGVRPGDPR